MHLLPEDHGCVRNNEISWIFILQCCQIKNWCQADLLPFKDCQHHLSTFSEATWGFQRWMQTQDMRWYAQCSVPYNIWPLQELETFRGIALLNPGPGGDRGQLTFIFMSNGFIKNTERRKQKWWPQVPRNLFYDWGIFGRYLTCWRAATVALHLTLSMHKSREGRDVTDVISKNTSLSVLKP